MFEHISKDKILIVFCNEIICNEEVISDSFSQLCNLAAHPSPAAHQLHKVVRVILNQSALVSLILFPTHEQGHKGARASFLRDELGVDENSLLRNRALRNHLAHLDERLDSWILNSENKTFGRGMLGARSDANKAGIASEDILGLYDPKSFIYSFLEDDIRVDNLVSEIKLVSHKSREKLLNLSWVQKE